MITKVSYILALLIAVLYYGYLFNGSRFPTSFCAGARYITKEGHKKYQFIPVIAGCTMSVLMGIVAFNLSAIGPLRIVLAPLSVICALCYLTVSATITCYEHEKVFKVHGAISEIAGAILTALSVMLALSFYKPILILVEVMIILGLRSISKQTTRNVLTIFWYEMSAFIMFFITTGILILELL